MNSIKIIRYSLAGIVLGISVGNVRFVATTHAQDTNNTKPAATRRVREGGRDPFRKFEPRRASAKVIKKVWAPSIQERIAQYKAQKVAAMKARMVAPKPTTALLLSEMEIVGISRTPRGYAAIVEATPIKLSYVIYPGERFYDGQLVAIEDNRLVFRREIVLSDGRRERSVEVKALRQPSAVNLMSAAKTAPASLPLAESDKSSEQPAAAARPQ
ncbi:MAG: hypothetical protein H0U18_14495 [Pyrinomonadaceae bacterium]|nr:hypothetical protein [Pyrinomonadaceae bacterium]